MKKVQKDMHSVRIAILNDEYAVYVIWGKQNKRLKWLRYHFDDDSIIPDTWHLNRGTTHTREGYMPVINLHNKLTYSVLAHEACHAIDSIFNYIGDNNRPELFAHSVGSILRGVEKYVKNSH